MGHALKHRHKAPVQAFVGQGIEEFFEAWFVTNFYGSKKDLDPAFGGAVGFYIGGIFAALTGNKGLVSINLIMSFGFLNKFGPEFGVSNGN